MGSRFFLVLAFLSIFATGCGEATPPMAPARGKVTYKGQPVRFGTVMFQPKSGQPARGEIQSDGSFELWTYNEGDGAAVGTHGVRITSYEGQAPTAPGVAQREPILGKSLIPPQYANVESSGITAEVKPGAAPFQFDLK